MDILRHVDTGFVSRCPKVSVQRPDNIGRVGVSLELDAAVLDSPIRIQELDAENPDGIIAFDTFQCVIQPARKRLRIVIQEDEIVSPGDIGSLVAGFRE